MVKVQEIDTHGGKCGKAFFNNEAENSRRKTWLVIVGSGTDAGSKIGACRMLDSIS